jgi:hypothetical protein
MQIAGTVIGYRREADELSDRLARRAASGR